LRWTAADGLNAIVVRINGVDTYYYTYTDHLGSITAVTNAAGVVVAEQNFDPWGRKRNPADWTYNNIPAVPSCLYRGYTGHEHLPRFTLVNMNGRLYDPVLGRMLSVDNFVQAPEHTQSYNRYTDPSGELPHLAIIGIAGLAGGLANYGIQSAKGNINSAGDGWRAFGSGALGAALVASGASSLGPALLQVGLAQLNGLLPSVNIPIGNHITLSLSPALALGAGGIGFGFSAGLSADFGPFAFGTSFGIMSYGPNQMTKTSFSETRFSNWVSLGDDRFNVVFGTNKFSGGDVGQRTGYVSFGSRNQNWSASYENDGTPFKRDDPFPLGDGGDSYRTAAVTIRYKDFSAGTRIFTGYRDYKNTKTFEGYPKGIVGNPEINLYKFAAAYIGFGNYRAGWNHYMIGHAVQNVFAHTLLSPQAYIPWRDGTSFKPNSIYGGYFTNNPYTNW
jgi:Bacterial toxin 23